MASSDDKPSDSAAPADSTPEKDKAHAKVGRMATIAEALPMDQPTVIGIYGKPNAFRALIRLGDGRVIKAKPGKRVGGGRIAAISDSAVLIQFGDSTTRLTLPKT